MISGWNLRTFGSFILHTKDIVNRQIFIRQTSALRNPVSRTHFELYPTLLSSISYSTNMSTFRFSDYDCIGFDLDHTLLRYHVTNLVLLEYEILSKYLVREKGYSPKHLLKPLTDSDLDFMQKGLFLDFVRGNILRLNPSGKIIRACHGTKLLTVEEINSIYPQQRWSVIDAFCKDILSTWNGPLSMQMRSLLDYFDFPSSIIFAKIVDTLDEEHGKPLNEYNIWPDILEGLFYMFYRTQFELNDGEFFPSLKLNPEKYLVKCPEQTISWLREMKRNKKTFLITGSNADLVEFTASYALGKDWKSLFDVIICYAKKPGFFVDERPFLRIIDLKEHNESIALQDLKQDEMYSQGNWKGLVQLLAQLTKTSKPKCLYVGDNLVQDIFIPKTYANCDTVVVIEELMSEGMIHQGLSHPDEKILNSKIWGSYFCLSGSGEYSDSFWSNIIQTKAKLCIPRIELINHNLLDKSYPSFHEHGQKESGYYPAIPLSKANL